MEKKILINKHRDNAENLYELKEYHASLKSFQFYMSERGTQTSFAFFRKARTASNTALRGIERKKFWNSCSDQKSIKFHQSLKLLLCNNFDAAKEQFSLAARDIFQDKIVYSNWTQAFDKICNAIENGQALQPIEFKSLKKIFVSGMGWSGSGALYDFFSEFSNIHSLKDENRFIEGPSSLYSIYHTILNKKDVIPSFLNLFFTSFLGYNVMNDSGDFKLLRTGRSFSQGNSYIAYSKIINLMMNNASQFLCSKSNQLDSFQKFSNDVINVISCESYCHSHNKVLLDNCVHINNLKAFNFIENAVAFCVFRDPRSNFVALKNEFKGYRQNAIEFIKTRAKKYNSCHKLVSTYLTEKKKFSSDPKIIMVQFEKFVLSESYRKNIAQIAGLNINDHAITYKYFKPWESEKNVFLHETYENQDEIKAIEEALPEYCVDVHKLKQEAIQRGDYVSKP